MYALGKRKRRDQPSLLAFLLREQEVGMPAWTRLTWAYILSLAIDHGMGRVTHFGLFWVLGPS